MEYVRHDESLYVTPEPVVQLQGVRGPYGCQCKIHILHIYNSVNVHVIGTEKQGVPTKWHDSVSSFFCESVLLNSKTLYDIESQGFNV